MEQLIPAIDSSELERDFGGRDVQLRDNYGTNSDFWPASQCQAAEKGVFRGISGVVIEIELNFKNNFVTFKEAVGFVFNSFSFPLREKFKEPFGKVSNYESDFAIIQFPAPLLLLVAERCDFRISDLRLRLLLLLPR